MLKSRVNAETQLDAMNKSTVAGKGANSFTAAETVLHYPLSSVRLEHVVTFDAEYLAKVKEADLDFFNDHMATLVPDKPYCLCRTQSGNRTEAGKYWYYDPSSNCLNLKGKKETKADGTVITKRWVQVVHPDSGEVTFVRQRDLKGSMKTGYTNAVEVTAEQADAAFGGRTPIDVTVAITPLSAKGLGLEADWSDAKLHAQILADLEDSTPSVDSTPPVDSDSGNDEDIPF